MTNYIRDKYIKRIKFWFFRNYFFEATCILVLLTSIYYDIYGIDWFAKNWESFGVFGIVINIPSTIFFIGVLFVRKRLIVSITHDSNSNSLICTYDGNNTNVLDFKKAIDERMKKDWALSSFLSSRNGIGTTTKAPLYGYILLINKKKFYLVSNILSKQFFSIIKFFDWLSFLSNHISHSA